MILRWIAWLAGMAGFGALYLYVPNGWTLTLAAASAAVPLVSALLTLPAARKLTAELSAPDTMSKGVPAVLLLTLRNRSILPIPRVHAVLTAENRLTGECAELRPEFSVGARCTETQELCFSAAFCGSIRLELTKLRVSDLFGLLYFPVNCGLRAELLAVPEVFEPRLLLPQPTFSASESERYSETKPGYDFAETFQVRDYADGDSPKQVHWKLSTKLDRLVVRDPSLPLDRRVLLLWERGCQTETPAQSDAMCAAVVSLCSALVKSGIACRTVWNEADAADCTVFEFREETDVYDMLPKLLSAGKTDSCLAERYLGLYGPEKQDHVIYVTAGDADAAAALCPEEKRTVLCCGGSASANGVYAFCPENAAEALCEIDLT